MVKHQRTRARPGGQRVAGLILAAGLSSRMHGFKPLLPLFGKKIVEHAIDLFLAAGVTDIVTVTGYRAAELGPVVAAAGSQPVVNEGFHKGMFSSVRRGAEAIRGRCEAFFLLPVDIPLVRPRTIRLLLDSFTENPEALVCYPQFQGRRGHPPLIDAKLIEPILHYAGEGGMRGLLRGYEDRAAVVEVADPFTRLDLDCSEDLFRLKNLGEHPLVEP